MLLASSLSLCFLLRVFCLKSILLCSPLGGTPGEAGHRLGWQTPAAAHKQSVIPRMTEGFKFPVYNHRPMGSSLAEIKDWQQINKGSVILQGEQWFL